MMSFDHSDAISPVMSFDHNGIILPKRCHSNKLVLYDKSDAILTTKTFIRQSKYDLTINWLTKFQNENENYSGG